MDSDTAFEMNPKPKPPIMQTYDDYSPTSDQDFASYHVLPVSPPPQPYSRPLPKIPRPLTCKRCRTCITSSQVLLPPSLIPPGSRAFKGFSGRASLFMETYNVRLARPGVQLMATGAHTMQEITCSTCSLYLGWKIVRAHDRSEKWKEGNSLLELENLQFNVDAPLAPYGHARSTSSDSNSSISDSSSI